MSFGPRKKAIAAVAVPAAPPSLKLSGVFGLTSQRSSSLGASDNFVVFSAGGVVVAQPLLPAPQTFLKRNAATSKAICCVAVSKDAGLVAAGEAGHQPRISIWNIQSASVVAELVGHKFGVLACAFSPNSRFLVSVGFQHDGFIYVWNIATGAKVACNRISAKITSVCFDDTGLFFITSGYRHFKYWAFDSTAPHSSTPSPVPSVAAFSNSKLTSSQQPPNAQQTQQIPLVEGSFATVGEHKNSLFMDVVYLRDPNTNQGHAYSITEKGILVLFNQERVMEKWVDLKVNAGFSIAVCLRFIVCGCSDGVIRLFEPTTMKYIATLPKPHYLGIDIAHSVGTSYTTHAPPDGKYPDTISVKVDSAGSYVSAIYSDHSLFIWDVKDVKHIGKFKSFLNHSDCVWGVEMIPDTSADYHRPITPTLDAPTSPSLPPYGLPPNSFVTYSSDTTMRFWNIDGTPTSNSDNGDSEVHRYFRRNIYSRQLLKIVYTSLEEYISLQKTPVGEGVDDPTNTNNASTNSATRQNTDKSGIRSLRISTDGKLLASGDRSGNLRIYELDTFTQLHFLEAHDGEILGIDFAEEGSLNILATASRDRLIHVFDVRRDSVTLAQTLDEHTSSITGVRFCEGGKKLVSCAADKSIVFRALQQAPNTLSYTPYHTSHPSRSTIFDIDITPAASTKEAATLASVSQDRKLHLLSVATGKPLRAALSPADESDDSGGLLKVSFDTSGRYAVTAAADKCIRIFDLNTGVVVARGAGAHSEGITSVKFSLCGRWVVSCGAEGVVFLWKVGDDVRKGIEAGLRKRGVVPVPERKRLEVSENEDVDVRASLLPPSGRAVAKRVEEERLTTTASIALDRTVSTGSDFMTLFKNDEGLPLWARGSVVDEDRSVLDLKTLLLPKRGSWAQRVNDDGIQLYSEAKDIEKPVAAVSHMFERRYSIESSIGSLSRAGSSGSIPGNDIIVQEVEEKEDEVSQAEEVPEDEATIFVGTSPAIDDASTTSFSISEPPQGTISDMSDTNQPELPVEIEPSQLETEEANEPTDKLAVDPSGRKSSSLEDYLNTPIDPSVLRQSMSSKHVLARDPSRKPGAIVVETILEHLQEQQKHFEASMGIPAIDTKAIPSEPTEMAEKKPSEAVGSPIRSPSVAAAIEITCNGSAINKEVIEAIASTPTKEQMYEDESFEEEEEEVEVRDEDEPEDIDTTQVLKDLKTLKTLTNASAALLRKLESLERVATTEEQELTLELKNALVYVKECAQGALRVVSEDTVDQATLGMLEKYSEVLVGMVREKLVVHREGEQ